MNLIPQARPLKKNKEYIVITFDTNQTFRGLYDDWGYPQDASEEINIYYKIPGRKYQEFVNNIYFICNNKKYIFNECDKYYDVEVFICEMKRTGQKARQQMEIRSLNMILKRLVNEEFQW
jgi:hypothetical protein